MQLSQPSKNCVLAALPSRYAWVVRKLHSARILSSDEEAVYR